MDTTHQTSSTTGRSKPLDTQFLSRQVTKVMIQEIPTRRYLRNGGFWTPDIEKATVFDNKSAAIEAANGQEFTNVQLVVSREFKEWEILSLRTAAT